MRRGSERELAQSFPLVARPVREAVGVLLDPVGQRQAERLDGQVRVDERPGPLGDGGSQCGRDRADLGAERRQRRAGQRGQQEVTAHALDVRRHQPVGAYLEHLRHRHQPGRMSQHRRVDVRSLALTVGTDDHAPTRALGEVGLARPAAFERLEIGHLHHDGHRTSSRTRGSRSVRPAAPLTGRIPVSESRQRLSVAGCRMDP